MKAYLGSYYHWFRPCRWAKDLIYWWNGFGKGGKNVGEHEAYEALRDRINESRVLDWLQAVETFFDDRHKRVVKVRVDSYDVWNAEHTLALIIVPVLKLLREKKNGAPYTDDADAPAHLSSTAVGPAEDFHTDANHFKRWNWILDEMIWAFEQVVDDSWEEQFSRNGFDKEGHDAYQQRINNGVRLFGRYYQALWD